MDWLENMNRAMDYIEENLAREISYDRVARLAGCSRTHFQRMFPFLTGVSLSEYIRRRRLTLAAYELRATGARVIDVALRYGYDAPEAFSRAFRSLHGVPPALARKDGVLLKAYPRMSFQMMIKGETEMKYRVEQREAFQVFGVWAEIGCDQEKAFEQIPRFFRQCDEDGTTAELNGLLGRFPDNYTISAMFDHGEDSFKYMLCNYLPRGLSIPEKFYVLAVPAATWAVFDAPQCDVRPVLRRIWSEWFPSSGYEMAEGPQFEMYYGLARHENGMGEVWVPVRRQRV